MPKFNVEIEHNKPPLELAAKMQDLVSSLSGRFQGSGLSQTWNETHGDFTFKSMNFNIKGTVDVSDKNVIVHVELPFAAMIFKNQVIAVIKKNLEQAIA